MTSPAQTRIINTSDGSQLRAVYSRQGDTLPIMSVFEVLREYPKYQDVLRLINGMRLDGHRYYTCNQGVTVLAAAEGWARRWLNFGSREAA